jgi:hypothetical protein
LEFEDYSNLRLQNPNASQNVAKALEKWRKPPIPYAQRLEVAKKTSLTQQRK